jgi:hypothetical protein
MLPEIALKFTTLDGQYQGAYFHDYFSADGLDRAKAAQTVEQAETILRATYLGADVDGIGVKWEVVP